MRRISSATSGGFDANHLITRAVAALIIVLGLAFASTGASAAGKGEACGGFIGFRATRGCGARCPRAMQGGRRIGQCDVIPGLHP